MTELAATTTPTTTPDDHQVFNWILSGASEHEIHQAIAATWPTAKSKPLIVAAMDRISKAADPDAAIVKGWTIEATRSVYAKALEAGDYPTALRAIRQVKELSR